MWIGHVWEWIKKLMNRAALLQNLFWRACCFALLTIMEMIIIIAVIIAIPISVDIRNIEQNYALFQASVGNDQEQAGTYLSALRADVSRLGRHVRIPCSVASRMGWVPRYGPTIQVIPQLFDLAESGVVSADEAWQLLSRAGAWASVPGADHDTAFTWIENIPQADWSAWAEASASLKSDMALFEMVDAEALIPALADKVSLGQSVTDLLTLSLDLFEPGCMWLAASQEKRLLLLAQNNDELRATGGFLSSIGELAIVGGIPTIEHISDSYAIEDWSKPHPDPPQALRDYMGLDLWVTRDGNWWPDFPTSAQAVAELYELNQGQPVDGVLAIDMMAAEGLVDSVTPLTLADGSRLLTGEVGNMFRESWSLPVEELTTEAVTITATHPFSDVQVMLSYSNQTGEAWFDALSLCDDSDPDTNLIRNNSFEESGGGAILVPAWQTSMLDAEDGLVDDVSQMGKPSLHIVGQPGVTKRIWQRLGVAGEAGQVFRISGQSRAIGASMVGPKSNYAIIVTFLGPKGKEQRINGFPGLSHDWASAGTAAVLGDWWRHRKDTTSEVVMAAITKVLSEPQSVPWQKIMFLVQTLVEQRHLQAYMVDPALQQVLAQHGWDGSLVDTAGDYVLVVDSNVGYNKVSASVEQSITYQVDLRAMPIRALLSIQYENMSEGLLDECNKYQQYVPLYEAMSQGCYWDYVRVYVPQGCTLFDARGGDEPVHVTSEASRMVLSTSMVLAPGEKRTLEFEYSLPSLVLNDHQYELYIQKQAGTNAIPLLLQVSPPEPLAGVLSNAQWYSVADGFGSDTDLLVDRHWAASFVRK